VNVVVNKFAGNGAVVKTNKLL